MEDLIVVKQLPVIEEQLRALKGRWEQLALDAEAMVCTADTIQSVKTFRANMRKEFDEVEIQRKAAKNAIMERYNQFEAVYKECVTTAFTQADKACALKINEVEDDMRHRCEEGLQDYFAELCAVRHLDWLEYERACIKVDMASAKAKTPTKLRKQLVEFVTRVADSVDRIMELDNAEEIMVEFKCSLDAADAICKVHERNQRIEEERARKEEHGAIQAQEAEPVRRVEALSPPVQQQAPIHILRPEASAEDAAMCQYIDHLSQKTIAVSLVMHPTKEQFENKIRPILTQLKQICDMEGIKYE